MIKYEISDLIIIMSYISDSITEAYQSIILLSDSSISLIRLDNECFINVDIT